MFKKIFENFLSFGKSGEPSVRDTIEELIEEKEEGEASLDPEEKTLLTNILNLRNVCARDVMVPRADIMAIPAKISYEELAARLPTLHYARLPVYKGTLDEVLGFIHIRDLGTFLASPSSFNCQDILQDILFVSPSMRLLDLLLQMKVTKVPLALVVDEYGGVDGLITTWDIIKELLGDLSTSGDEEIFPEIMHLSDHSLITDARLPLEEFCKLVSLELKKEEAEDVETVGGFIFSLIDRVPAKHELIRSPQGLTFEILDVDPRRVKKVRVYRKPISPHDAPPS